MMYRYVFALLISGLMSALSIAQPTINKRLY